MKNKKLNYFLGVAVVLIWGSIIFKIFKAVSGDDLPISNMATAEKRDTVNYELAGQDTAKLNLNYRDPFSEKKAEPVEIPVSELVHKPVIAKPVKTAINWDVIRYSGFVRNQGSKKLIAMISINGRQLMMSEGETLEKVKLLKNLKDSIKVSFEGATKFIVLNTKL